MDYRWFIVDGCDRHYGDVVPSPQKYKTQACRNPAEPEIPRRNKPHTVQDEVDAAVTAWEQGFYSNSTQNDRCPLCRADTAPTVVVAQGTWAPTANPPAHFFVATSDTNRELRPPVPSDCVLAFGDRYRLCAVIYQTKFLKDDFKCFTCQALFDGCWYLYNSCSCDKPEHTYRYTPEPRFEVLSYDGKHKRLQDLEPVLFAYVRDEDASASVYSKTSHPREDRRREWKEVREQS